MLPVIQKDITPVSESRDAQKHWISEGVVRQLSLIDNQAKTLRKASDLHRVGVFHLVQSLKIEWIV